MRGEIEQTLFVNSNVKTIKGVVEGNVVVPEEPAILPEGAEVTINLPTNLRLLRHAGV